RVVPPGHLAAHAPVQERTAATAVSGWPRIRHRKRLRVVMDQETFLRGRAHRDALPALRHVKVTVADATGSERGPLPRPGHLAPGHLGEHRTAAAHRRLPRGGPPPP